MAILNCIECNGKVSSEAASCPHCGYVKGARPTPDPEQTPPPAPQSLYTQPRAKTAKANPLKIIGGCVIGLIILLLIIGAAVRNQSTCDVTSLQNREEAFIVEGQLDYGIIADAGVKLNGKARLVTVTVRLETNQGDITKSERIAVSDNGRRQIQLQFPEPTLGTKVNQSYATCE